MGEGFGGGLLRETVGRRHFLLLIRALAFDGADCWGWAGQSFD